MQSTTNETSREDRGRQLLRLPPTFCGQPSIVDVQASTLGLTRSEAATLGELLGLLQSDEPELVRDADKTPERWPP